MGLFYPRCRVYDDSARDFKTEMLKPVMADDIMMIRDTLPPKTAYVDFLEHPNSATPLSRIYINVEHVLNLDEARTYYGDRMADSMIASKYTHAVSFPFTNKLIGAKIGYEYIFENTTTPRTIMAHTCFKPDEDEDADPGESASVRTTREAASDPRDTTPDFRSMILPSLVPVIQEKTPERHKWHPGIEIPKL